MVVLLHFFFSHIFFPVCYISDGGCAATAAATASGGGDGKISNPFIHFGLEGGKCGVRV